MESRTGLSTKEQIEQLMTRVDEMNEKLYEFETNKKNNLIFYGIPGEVRETPPVLMTKVRLNARWAKKLFFHLKKNQKSFHWPTY